jgi:hypothetical protein
MVKPLSRLKRLAGRPVPGDTCFQSNRWRTHIIRIFLSVSGILASAWQLQAAAPTQAYAHGDPTAEEQLMLELVNRARLNPSAEAARFGITLNEGITNNPISPDPKQPLAFNPDLLQSARAHSQWMLDNDIFAHVETNGSDPGSRMEAAGYVFDGSYSYGENIAWRGVSAPTIPVGPTVTLEHEDLFVDKTVPDRGHRLNILDPGFREIGIGAKPGIFKYNGTGYGSVMVTQDFASSDANPGPFLVGVVYRDADANGAYSVGEALAGVTVTPATGSYYAVSSTSGGYAIPITGLSGTLAVTFAGGTLPQPVTKSIQLNGSNVKLDFEYNTDTAPPVGFVPTSLRFSAAGQFQADVQGPANTHVSVQRSSDLVNWTEIHQVTVTTSPVHVTDSPGAKHQYYRTVKL